MQAIREIIEDAPEQLILKLPSHLHHQRLEVTILPLDEVVSDHLPDSSPRYQRWPIKQRSIYSRDKLHER
ncbi:MAG: hypothetical protein H7833_11350 [Magnetococcus sp. DMHC-1]|nr:hypothetical protein [Magnetococcales bacterium]